MSPAKIKVDWMIAHTCRPQPNTWPEGYERCLASEDAAQQLMSLFIRHNNDDEPRTRSALYVKDQIIQNYLQHSSVARTMIDRVVAKVTTCMTTSVRFCVCLHLHLSVYVSLYLCLSAYVVLINQLVFS